MDKKNDSEEKLEVDSELSIPAQIQMFAAKLGQEVGQNFSCYIYRVVKDEETGKYKRPFVKKYSGGNEPDPLEIAEKFRCGTYSCQFVWRVKGQQYNKSYTLDIDAEAFPKLTTEEKRIVPYSGASGNMSEQMQLQLATIHEISDVMKTAYSSGNGQVVRGAGQAGDPLDMFTGLMETMESSFARAMSIQSKIMERVFTRNMEKQYGLAEEVTAIPGVPAAIEEGMVGKYAPVVREIVEGIKSVIGFFGDSVPAAVVQQVKKDGRFKALLQDEKALVVIGQALRKEFGLAKASELMHTFGVRIAVKDTIPEKVSKTPVPASLQARGREIVQKPAIAGETGKGAAKSGEVAKKVSAKK
jgi:hypothetical protein